MFREESSYGSSERLQLFGRWPAHRGSPRELYRAGLAQVPQEQDRDRGRPADDHADLHGGLRRLSLADRPGEAEYAVRLLAPATALLHLLRWAATPAPVHFHPAAGA